LPLRTRLSALSFPITKTITVWLSLILLAAVFGVVQANHDAGYALDFDGVNEYADIGDQVQVAGANLTLEAWVYVRARNRYAGIVSNVYDTGATESGYALMLDAISGVYFSLTATGQSTVFLSSGVNTLALNEWHHIAGTWDGNTMRVYVDGVQQATQANVAAGIDYTPAHNLNIGRFADDNEFEYVSGIIDEVRVWSVTRSAADIQSNMFRTVAGNETGLVAYWRLDEGSGTSITDQTGNGNNGTFANMDDTDWVISTAPIHFTTAGPSSSFDDSGNPSTYSGGAAYNVNGFYGHVYVDNGEGVANGGNHFQGEVQVFSIGHKVCINVPNGYQAVNPVGNPACHEDSGGGRKDFGIRQIDGINGAANGAAVVADEPAVAAGAVSGYAMGATGGTFSCPVASGNVNVTVPVNVVADDTRFLCEANENAPSASAPVGYSLVGSQVDLTTDIGLATFDQPLTVCLSHTDADILKAGGAAANLRVGFFNGVLWQPLPLTSSSANETCGLTDHFTQFGLLAATPTALPAMGASVSPVVWIFVALAVVSLASGGIMWRRLQLTG